MLAEPEHLSSETLLTTSRFSVVRQEIRLANGQHHSRETIQHAGAVVILPWFADQRIVLLRNYRIAIGRTLWELPAGTREPSEEPQLTAARELEEETGYRAERFESLGEFWMSPGILNERMFLYVAQGLRPGTMALEAGELLEPEILTWNETLDMLDRGEIQDAKTIAALCLWERRLRAGCS